jgi:hypothetical protein
MSTKFTSKFFRVAVEGATTDGRKIERSWITQMAKNFNPGTYGARVWLEHIRGTLPDSPFRAYGDVTALKAEEVSIDGSNKLALFARIEPTPDLIKMTKGRQKIYTSIEINDKFADTGEAYLVGLAVTDSPASLGTEMLVFAAQNPNASPLAARKTSPGTLFSEATEVTLEFEEIETEAQTLTSKVKDMLARFNNKKTSDDARLTDISEAIESLLTHITRQDEQFSTDHARIAQLENQLNTQLTMQLQTQLQTLSEQFKQLQTTLAGQPAGAPRPPSAGGDGTQQTDC